MSVPAVRKRFAEGLGTEHPVRVGRFRTLLDAFGCNLGRGGQFWLLRTRASGRSGPEFHKKHRKCIKFFAKS